MERQNRISERISEMLTECNLSAAELAKDIGVSVSSVRRWKRGTKYMRLFQAVALADRFGCSLDYLTGRSDTYLDFTPRRRPPFYEQLRAIMNEKGVSRNRINRETRIKSSHFTDWKNGAEPHILSVIELADYLDVSVDILVGRDG